MNIRVLNGGYYPLSGREYKFLVVDDELVVGNFFVHKMLAASAFGTEEVAPTAAGGVTVAGGIVSFDWMSSGYSLITPEALRAGLEQRLREALRLQ